MATASLQKIFGLPPGACLRSSSGYFCRLPNGAIAYVPSIFRLPWHPDTARLVGEQDIRRLLRAETVELVTGIALLLAAIHFFYADIMSFYTAALSLPLALLLHGITLVAGAACILILNNGGMACWRINLSKHLPKAPAGLMAEALGRWSAGHRVWALSFLSGERAANLNKAAVILYLLMFACSGPLLVVILVLVALSGKAQTLDGGGGVTLAVYVMISIWAFVESGLVLHQRMQAGRQRRIAKKAAASSL
ncbi:MAG: hypothetical protein AAF942_09745 [Pseudomonadota bacterium]